MKNLRKVLFFVLFALATVLAFGMKNVMAADEVTETVSLSSGKHDGANINWTAANGEITITQSKASSSTAVNSSYVSAPRVYKGHILSFVATENYVITKIQIKVNGTYYGNSMTAGTVLNGNTVVDNTADVARTWASTSGGTHVVSSVNPDGLNAIYIQNVASTNVQLRITSIVITYAEAANATELTAGEKFAKLDTKSSLNLSYKSEVAEGSQVVTESINFTELGYTNQQDLVSEETNNVKFAFSKGTNKNNPPKYYGSGTAGRFYGGNTITISASGQITKVVLTLGNSDGTNEITANVGTFSTNTWTGSASEVVLTVSGSSGNRRIAAITVTVESSSVETITFNDGDAQLRFGAEIEAELFNLLKEEDANVTFGVAVIATESLEDAELTVETEGAYVADLEIAAVNDNGEAVAAAEATKYQFALVITGIKLANFDTEFTAVSYVCVNGTYYYMAAKAHSAVSIAQAYVNAEDTSAYSEHLNALRTLANLE